MDRETILRSLFDTSGYGLEVGPSYNPLLPKSAGYNVRTLDHADQATLVAKYGAMGQNTDRIEAVDYVSDGRAMHEVIGETAVFDFVFASHVVEHTTDLVAFLQDCEALLKPGGKLVLAVPDRRFCFDFFRPTSSLGEVLEAHAEGRSRHSFATVFDNLSLQTSRGGEIAWQRPQLGPFAMRGSPTAALPETRRMIDDGQYHDMHGWTFCPSSFRYIVKALEECGLIRLREQVLKLTNGFEFYVVLSTAADRPACTYDQLLLDMASELLDVTMPGGNVTQAESFWRQQYEDLVNSRSWRLTAPLRRVRKWLAGHG